MDTAVKHCADHVKKFDFYAYRVGTHFPQSIKPLYYGINAFFLEILRSREISKEQSICQTRLQWWASTLNDVEKDRVPREPIARVLSEVKHKSKVNFKLLHRLVNF